MSPSAELIERLYGEHRQAVLGFARSRNPALAEDVVSETFAVAMRRPDAIPPGAERAWLIGVAENVLRNQQRKEYRAASLPGVLRPYSATSTAPHEPPAVGPALSELPPTERDVLTLTAFEGLSSAEAGERLGLSPGSTRNAMVRARRNLAVQLAGFGVLLLVPVLFFLLRDRGGDVAPQAERLAQTLRRAESLQTDATVSRGSRSQRYGVQLDRSAGTQRITLPDGQIAEGPIGGSLRIVPQAGVTAQQRQAASRDHASALAALETITSGDLQEFLAQARRAGVHEHTAGSGPDQVTTVQGPFTTHDGDQVELRVTLSGDPAALRQLKVRPAGRAGAPWTTVDVRRWEVQLPAAGSAPTAAAGPSTPTVAAADAPVTARDTASSGDWSSPERRSGEIRSGGSRRSGAKKLSRATAARNRRELRAVPKYTGDAGAVLHTRSRTVFPKARGRSARTTVSESWSEQGGGQRYRSIDRYFKANGGKFLETMETWRSPQLFAIIPRAGDNPAGHRTPLFVIYCSPVSAPPVPDPEQVALQAARTHLSDLRRGPTIKGQLTRRLDVTLAGTSAGAEAPSLRLYLNPKTGMPMRREYLDRNGEVEIRTTFRLWDEIPAGGSSAQLAGTPPKEFLVDKTLTCTDGPPAGADPSSAPTTPVG